MGRVALQLIVWLWPADALAVLVSGWLRRSLLAGLLAGLLAVAGSLAGWQADCLASWSLPVLPSFVQT